MGETAVKSLEGPASTAPRRRLRVHPRLRPRLHPHLWPPHTPRRPRLWFEILLIAAGYWTYSLIRNAVPEQQHAALRNTDLIWRAEQWLGIAVERSVNHAVDAVTWLIVGMNYYYATLHFVVTIGVLVWLYLRHPGRYASGRLTLFATTVVALAGYYYFPLAPPRLMPDGGFIDTVLVHRTWGSMASGNLKHMSNQYAAMPSMHIGWSLWSGLAIASLARRTQVRILGLLYPVATLMVIVATANHFWLDAVGGALCVGFGVGLSYVWYGALPHRLTRPTRTRRPASGASTAASASASTGASNPAPTSASGTPHR
jgi:hypothetical protein